MPGISNNLYPPIFKKSYVPAFVKNCSIYFSISPYNSLSDINQNAVQVIVQNQKTNQSVLKRSLYPSGIKITSLHIDNEIKGEEKYYIEINSSDIEGGFKFNEYYKVQIRFYQFHENDTSVPTSSKGIDGWLNTKLMEFSQWSTVVLIKCISKPIISLKNFNIGATSTTITSSNLTILGTVYPQIEGDYQPYKSYRILIYNEGNTLLEDSKDKYFYDSNEIQYNCKYNFESDKNYILKIQLLTKNLYFRQEIINFYVNYATYEDFEANIMAEIDNKAACAIITLNNNIFSEIGTNIVIRRTSSKTNFSIWEDVYTTLVPSNSKLDLVWKDYTIESGVWYKYSVVKRNRENYRSVPIEIKHPIMKQFEDIFLATSKQQLTIRFDPQINNYSRVVSESLTETIGSKYPFIRRNGKVNYRTFSISGTISYFCDLQRNLMKSSQEDLYGNSANLYKEYNSNNNISLYNDIIQEKEFREKVIQFLYNNDVKLYKSATQGNVLVKLMNISLTPNNSLNRQIYSFTCTAYEIDEFNYQNCVKYAIQDEGEYVEQENLFISKLGQIIKPTQDIYDKDTNSIIKTKKDSYFGSQDLLSGLLKEKYAYLETENIEVQVKSLSYLKITLISNPYLIGISNGRPYQIKNQEEEAIYIGHIVIINGEYIIIGKEGIYELSQDDTDVSSLSFVSPNEQGIIDFEAIIQEKRARNKNVKQYSVITKVGQLWGDFKLINNKGNTIYLDIVNRYNLVDSKKGLSQRVSRIAGLRIQAQPGTSFCIKEKQDSQYETHTLNETGLLQFYDENTDIQGLYFIGSKLIEASEQKKNNLHQYEFYDTGETITLDKIKNPKNNYVYHMPSPQDKIQDESLTVSRTQLEQIVENNNALLIDNLLMWNTKFNEVSLLKDLESIGLLYALFDKYIFYQGSWFPFTDEHQVVLPNIEAIVDYYCIILREKY